VYRPDLDFETDTEQLTPPEAHDRFEKVTNLDAPELRDLRASKRNEVYLDKASGNQDDDNPPIPGGPLEDAIHLATTPRSEYGPDERAEVDELVNYGKRTFPQFEKSEGEALLPDQEPRVTKGEIALERWGFEPHEDNFP
jgi:hypothetical protein